MDTFKPLIEQVVALGNLSTGTPQWIGALTLGLWDLLMWPVDVLLSSFV